METTRNLLRAGRRRTCIIVCGMHRTGTSAVARTVNLLGADITKDPIAPGADNIRGYWESKRVVQIHEQLLEDLGSSSADPLPLPEDWIKTPFARLARERLTELIQTEFHDSSLFVVKDPRVCKLLPLWIELLADIDVDVVVAMTFRNPLEVAASLAKRDQMPLATSLLLYLSSYLCAGAERLAGPGEQAAVGPGVPAAEAGRQAIDGNLANILRPSSGTIIAITPSLRDGTKFQAPSPTSTIS